MYEVMVAAELSAATHEYLLELVHVGDVFVSQGLTERVGRQGEEVHARRHLQPSAGMPARAVDDQDDVLVGTSADSSGELIESELEEIGVDAWEQQPLDSPGRRLNEPVDVQPLVATAVDGDGTLGGCSCAATRCRYCRQPGSPRRCKRWRRHRRSRAIGR
jgi:hypothetical protein